MRAENIRDLASSIRDTIEPFSLDGLVAAVCSAFNVTRAALFGHTKPAQLSLARQVAMTIAYDDGMTFERVGEIFNRHHGTVIHARKAVYETIKHGSPRDRAMIKAVIDKFPIKQAITQ